METLYNETVKLLVNEFGSLSSIEDLAVDIVDMGFDPFTDNLIDFLETIYGFEHLEDMNDDEKESEKLIVFDDFINLPKKELKQIQKFFNSGRKYGYTVMALMQNITDAPIQLRRNIQIWILFKLNDINTIRNILKTTNNNDTDFKLIKQAYIISTQKKGDFFKINLLSGDDTRFSHNFLDFFSL